MFLTEKGVVPANALVSKRMKSGGITYSIWWNRIEPTMATYDKINEILDELDGSSISYRETQKGCYTVATINTLRQGYFIRRNKKDANNIEVCGCRPNEEEDLVFFRYKITQSYDSDFGALDAWIEFQMKVQEHTGKSLNDIYGGLPMEYHQYRGCVPSPINWASFWLCNKRGQVAENCVKADICSAYGTEASKTLPDCHPSVIQKKSGRVEPTAEYPFAFYLHSGHMAVYNEGDTYQLNQSKYITCDHTIPTFDFEEETLLCPAASQTLEDVFAELYEGRKDHPEYKGVMNMTIGMFHRKKTRFDSENLWPLAAVIKFRCNKRIVDVCEWLLERGHTPILINTDSIMWQGCVAPGMEEIFSDEKKLGNFTYEYKSCRAVMRSSKIYQVQDKETGETITRWSGSHTKKYTSMLAFGQIWQESVYDFLRDLEERNIIKWDNDKRRFINRKGEIYIDTKEAITELWQNK